MNTSQLFRKFKDLNVLIIGDVMIDSYMWGHVSRISPEAPVPVVAVNRKEDRLGGAANVALNIQSLGARPVLCSVIGKDPNGDKFLSLLKKQKISAAGILRSAHRPTTIKTRILGGNHQMMRVDEEIETELDSSATSALASLIIKLATTEKADVIIFEDYDKGTITPELIQKITTFAATKKIPTVVDPKKKNFLLYSNVTLFKPNLKELREGLKMDHQPDDAKSLSKVITPFIKKQNIGTALITLSEKGIYVQQGKDAHIIPAHIRDITDVSGAGDTVVSVAALCLAAGASPREIAAIANLAGGLVCEKAGVVPVNAAELQKEAAGLKF